MSIALVQSAPVSNTAIGTTHTCTLGASPTVDNLLVFLGRAGTGAVDYVLPTGVTSLIDDVDATTGIFRTLGYRVVQSGDGTGWSWTTTSSTRCDLEVVEFSGCATSSPADASNVSLGQVSTTSQTTGSTGTLAQADEVAVGMACLGSTNGGTEAVDSSFTLLDDATHAASLFGYRIVAATTALNPSFSWATLRAACGMIATFKAAAEAAGQPTIKRFSQVPFVGHQPIGQRRAF